MTSRSLIAPSANPLLEQALGDTLTRRGEAVGRLGELEPLALRLGLMQNTLRPRLHDPQLVVFAADHGLAVEGVAPEVTPSSAEQVRALLSGRWPLTAFARSQRIGLCVVDCGVAAELPPSDRLLRRKIAHGTRSARVGPAMSVEQAHAAMRAGMEIGESLRGNALICAGLGAGVDASAALVLARLTDSPLAGLALPGPALSVARSNRLLKVLQATSARHAGLVDPVEVLAAFGGFETAVMAGVMLVAASKRHLLMIDGLPACAALMVAARIAPPVTDYCVFCRSHSHQGIDGALALFRATALLELGLESPDGTGATLAWPMVRHAAALLSDVADGDEPTTPREDPGPERPR
jgi:nicotinate-nucleotide--dimethylbenzimidazole phosphoribosyltransferase